MIAPRLRDARRALLSLRHVRRYVDRVRDERVRVCGRQRNRAARSQALRMKCKSKVKESSCCCEHKQSCNHLSWYYLRWELLGCVPQAFFFLLWSLVSSLWPAAAAGRVSLIIMLLYRNTARQFVALSLGRLAIQISSSQSRQRGFPYSVFISLASDITGETCSLATEHLPKSFFKGTFVRWHFV